MWSMELCHRQWPWSTFKVIFAVSVRKCSLVMRYPIENPSRLTKDDTADDLEWLLKGILGTTNGFIVCI